MQAPPPEQLSQAGAAGAPLWSGGDRKAPPPSPREKALSKDRVFQPSSSQVIKVKALRILGKSRWGGMAMLCSKPHHRPSDGAPAGARV